MSEEKYDPSFRPWDQPEPYDPYYWPGSPSLLRGRVKEYKNGTTISSKTGKVLPTWHTFNLGQEDFDSKEDFERDMLAHYDYLELIESDEQHAFFESVRSLRRDVNAQILRGAKPNPIVLLWLEPNEKLMEEMIYNLPISAKRRQEDEARPVQFLEKLAEEEKALLAKLADLQKLRERVRKQIKDYVPPARPESGLQAPLTPEELRERAEESRAILARLASVGDALESPPVRSGRPLDFDGTSLIWPKKILRLTV